MELMQQQLQKGAQLKEVDAKQKMIIKDGLRPRDNNEEEVYAAMDDPNLYAFRREQLTMAYKESLRTTGMDEERRRYLVYDPPTSIGGRESQCEPGGGSCLR